MKGITHGTTKDLEYFQKSLNRSNRTQLVNYTWQKPCKESPSFYKPHVRDESNTKSRKNTLDLMATYIGHAHVIKQNKWETGPTNPPNFLSYPQARRTNVLSSMNQ